jgi:hypothetical protein
MVGETEGPLSIDAAKVFFTSGLLHSGMEVLVPAGTRLQRSRALPAFGARGGGEQFEILDRIPDDNFGIGVELQ